MISDCEDCHNRACELFGCALQKATQRKEPMDLINRLENSYQFECEAGPLKNCAEWQKLRDGITTAIAALEKTKKEFEVSGKPPGYVGTIYVDTALAALSHS